MVFVLVLCFISLVVKLFLFIGFICVLCDNVSYNGICFLLLCSFRLSLLIRIDIEMLIN